MKTQTIKSQKSLIQTIFSFATSLWKFSRPHTIIGTSLSLFSLYFIALAIAPNPDPIAAILTLLLAWLACLNGNVYIVGLNQLEDVAIDRINKPHLPLASGEFSLQQGRWIVTLTGILGLLLAAIGGTWLFITVIVSLAIGTAYSLPPFRLKRFPFFAALCILSVRGAIVNLGLFSHFNDAFGGDRAIPPVIIVLTLFILVFSVAIALFKDVPDMEGDRAYEIATFTLILGKERIFGIVLGIVSACYLGTIAAVAVGFLAVNAWILAGGQGILLIWLWWRARGVNLEEKSAIASFYQSIWKLFFLEYLLFPMACWWR